MVFRCKHFGILAGAIGLFLISAVRSEAIPAPIFRSHLQEIRENLPSGWKMRLPARILLGGPADDDLANQLIVKVISTRTPPGLTVGLFTCKASTHPCLIGSLSVDSATSENALREYQRHQAAAAPIKLANGVRGYLLHGPVRKPQSDFSSVMWEQDGLLYTITFLAVERQNLLYMAYSMTQEAPYSSLANPNAGGIR
ncbi:hypothetical protein BST81_11790 [Leptolyngbya sp. 'hensonii']|uniref:hypothetical protein n=1 Tax=Leptolyngbya sp. 'hensonii' TaxID=1922337 RepID=UPI00094FB231|nr:hypothetical protein [Leptolyngbya sp. 'hensonii']OLP18233.1 hypothetical protein BST81_11790 [Leptolyngbya sp. 'hensonii']